MSRRSIKSITTIDYLENGKWAVFVTIRNSKKKKNETVATMTSESVVALVQRLKDEKFVLSPMAKYRLQDELVDSKNNHSMKITQEEIEQYISDSDIARLLEDNPPSDIDIDEKNE
jgi:ribosomal protein S8